MKRFPSRLTMGSHHQQIGAQLVDLVHDHLVRIPLFDDESHPREILGFLERADALFDAPARFLA